MSTGVEERLIVAVPAAEVFAAVADVRRMARWSPECFAVWIWRRENGRPARFIGWSRRGPFVWFTTFGRRDRTTVEPARELMRRLLGSRPTSKSH